jgi:hypothetical protein
MFKAWGFTPEVGDRRSRDTFFGMIGSSIAYELLLEAIKEKL